MNSQKLWVALILLILIFSSILDADKNYIQFIGHATALIHLDGMNILTDPNWNDRDIFLKRHNPPAIKISDLPPIDIILISHGHFDHLDLNTLKELYKRNNKIKTFLPRNLGFLLEELGTTNFKELNPDDNINYKRIKIKAYRARHNGTRYWFSTIDTSLALCYLIKGSKTIFFSGDTGYTNLFQKIGNEAKIDIALLEIQGWKVKKLNSKQTDYTYSKWDEDRKRGYVYTGRHLHPYQAVQAFIDLKAKKFLPIHYDAFFVEFRKHDETPIEILKEEFEKRGLSDRLIFETPGKKIIID